MRPSPALVVAFIALFVAGAGTATAARLISGKQIRNNSVTGTDIRNNSVTGTDIRNNSLGNRDVKNGSLLLRDFKSGQVPAGPQGRAGRNGFGALLYVSKDFTVGASAAAGQGTTPCPTGTYPTGGDAYVTDTMGKVIDDTLLQGQFFTFDTQSGNTPNGWRAFTAANTAANDPGAKVLVVEAICANASFRPTVILQTRQRSPDRRALPARR